VSAQDKKPTRKQKSMDAIELLKQDHEKVRDLFEKYTGAGAGERQAIAQRIFKELEIHAVLEEELFYPALQNQRDPDELASLQQGDAEINGEAVLDQPDDDDAEDDETCLDDVADEDDHEEDDIINAAFEDHQTVKQMIHRLKSLDPQTSDFHQGMMELDGIVSDHVAQEEEIFFLEAKIQLDIKTLGELMIERKNELLSMAA
jgi:hypothetical protein